MIVSTAPVTSSPRPDRRPARVGVALLLVLAVLLTGALTNTLLDRAERQTVPAYGSRVHVTGGEVNVYRHGDRGPTIVMLGGYATAAPALDFGPLIRQLGDFRVVVVEGFGYGYSDTVASPRTVENITGELHEAVAALQIDQPYVLLGHSIAGIYELYYANRYRAEIAAVIGVDASVPGQINGLAGQDNPWSRLVSSTGLLRIASTIMPSLVEPDSTAYTPQERRQMRMMVNWNWANPALLDEAAQAERNFAVVKTMSYPRDLAVLSFVTREGSQPDWQRLHRLQLEHLDHGELVELDGGHSLHWTQAAAMGQRIHLFLATALPR